ncbi:RNA polymerase I associated factor, A49-like protein [Hortaea werneckii]|uniref:RNA polymerase I associated factor, A49-like protein n=1 Tax=Hortaea werneckii TaxID=91943 RepID=A0A3M7FLY2_HORWE|nr:RNA polymerase I associated factor, A49-like protein [Hortaea werneckii]KAI7510165.1 RNA polymerase I associated factor, A49-like protein [Hortaea werneckii]RMY89813.1 hypothetical protein D0861_03992 [Hortaea werneckii]
MAEKDGKKRKRQSNGAESSSKKVAFGGGKGNIKVNYHDGNGLHPALVSAPGLTPPSIAFNPYAKPTSGKKSDAPPKPKTHDFLLQSSQHPRLDYTALPSSLDQHQSHYIAVYDPATNQLQITPAHHVSLRSIPRKISDESKAKGRSLAQQREALGQEFGTKKAKKVIASRTENAITKGNQSGAQSGAQNAVLENMADAEAEAPGKEQVEQDQLASKPIPRPNLSAESVEQVYTFNTLIPQGEARLVPVKDWQERARADQEMTFSHRFPAHRVAAIGKSDDMLKLKALSYLNLLLDFHDALQNAGRSGKKVPKKEILSKKMDKWPETLVDLVRRRFSNPQNELPKWHQDNLYTHMAALTLYVDGWTTNTTDLKEDLRIDNRQITQYFNELGCRVGPLTEKERERLGVPKAVAGSMRMARLKLPLDFPKPRAGRRR